SKAPANELSRRSELELAGEKEDHVPGPVVVFIVSRELICPEILVVHALPRSMAGLPHHAEIALPAIGALYEIDELRHPGPRDPVEGLGKTDLKRDGPSQRVELRVVEIALPDHSRELTDRPLRGLSGKGREICR